MNIAAGTRLGPYEVVSPLGAGGMGEVWRARDLRLEREVALKVLPESLARMAEQGPFYVYAAFLFTYGTTVLHSSRDLLLSALLTATALSAVTIPLSGYISDRIGRKRMYLIGAVTTGAFAFIYFAMMNTAIPGWIFLAVVLSFIPHDMMYGPQAALIAECFTPRLRYSGASLGYHLSSVIAGGPAPLIATALLAWTGSGYAIALYVLFCAIVSVTATSFLPDYTNRDISQEHDELVPSTLTAV